MLKRTLTLMTSLRLTVVLLALGIVVVFVGTLAQTTDGLWVAQHRYFRSWFATWSPHTAPWLVLPLPGGYLLGTLLLVNLVAAHVTRFKLTAAKSGIFLTHVGIIVLLVGQLLTDMLAVESRMNFTEGETRSFTEDFMKTELVFLADTGDGKTDEVISIPDTMLARGGEIADPRLPAGLRVLQYHENAQVRQRAPMVDTNVAPASTRGIGVRAVVEGVAPTREMDRRNLPALVAEVKEGGAAMGTWLFALVLDPQEIRIGEKTWRVGLRATRFYHPFSVRLLKTTHEVYPGTDTPRNFQSRVRLEHVEGVGDREVDISMNNPLRYRGLTFFQSQMGREEFEAGGRGTSGLQVVRNPSWLTPYFGCVLVGAGLVVQFLIHLVGFVRKRGAT